MVGHLESLKASCITVPGSPYHGALYLRFCSQSPHSCMPGHGVTAKRPASGPETGHTAQHLPRQTTMPPI